MRYTGKNARRQFPRLQLLRNESAQDTIPACPSSQPPPNGKTRPAPPLQLNTRQRQKQLAQTMRESEETRTTRTHMHAIRDTGHPHQFSPGQCQVPPECRRRSRPSNSKEKDSRCPALINLGDQPKQTMLVAAADNRGRLGPYEGKSSLELSSSALKALPRADEIRHEDPSGPVQHTPVLYMHELTPKLAECRNSPAFSACIKETWVSIPIVPFN